MSKYTNLLNEKIKESIESYIIEKELKPYDPLPSERELSEIFGVNRLTVRAALKRLRNEHHIFTEHGKGNFISPPKIQEDTQYALSFTSGWKLDGYETSSKVLLFETIEASLSLSRHLQIALGEKVYRLQRIRYLNNIPTSLETTHIPQKYCPGLDRYDFTVCSLCDTLMNTYHLALSRQEELISVARLTKNEANYLNARENDPAFFIKGTTFDDEKPVEYCLTLNCADRHALTSVLNN